MFVQKKPRKTSLPRPKVGQSSEQSLLEFVWMRVIKREGQREGDHFPTAPCAPEGDAVRRGLDGEVILALVSCLVKAVNVKELF